jgi:hypothetical protein
MVQFLEASSIATNVILVGLTRAVCSCLAVFWYPTSLSQSDFQLWSYNRDRVTIYMISYGWVCTITLEILCCDWTDHVTEDGWSRQQDLELPRFTIYRNQETRHLDTTIAASPKFIMMAEEVWNDLLSKVCFLTQWHLEIQLTIGVSKVITMCCVDYYILTEGFVGS